MNASQDAEKAINSTLETLQDLIKTTGDMAVTGHDFPGTVNGRDGLAAMVNNTVEELKKLKNPPIKGLENVPIPLDVLQYIEDGRNPDVYTREFVEATRKSNQYLKGKMSAMKELRDILGQKISAEFPEMQSVVEDVIRRTDG